MPALVDNAITARIIYLLVLPFEKWEAYKKGIIDKKGNVLISLDNIPKEDKDDWTSLHRLVSKLKKILAVIPAGDSPFVSIAAAYALIKEHLEHEQHLSEETNLRLMMNKYLYSISYDDIKYVKTVLEDAEGSPPSNIVSNVEGLKDTPTKGKKNDKRTIIRRSIKSITV